jgi:Na+/H+ antiporter NhaD/arsenite permease-like protein
VNSGTTIAAVAIFVATYTVLAVGRIPVYRIDRTGAALLGASLMVGTGVLSAEEAYAAFNFDTIILLLGMMIVVANLRVSGFFGVVNAARAASTRSAGGRRPRLRRALRGTR